ncbi:hypothetical protein [uncultured Sunxiuqinia sp.]|uniref:hypothetical protein n=1 Tax=uncultured Sunxiuqinia sp. TaxID=1573825 RepID=UPI0026385BC0|nr:hypothetical protein [uncultured Sunxiuqinia sp.]
MSTKDDMSRKVMRWALAIAFVFGAGLFTSQAQDEPSLFAVVDFMKVEAGDEGKYVDLEQKVWKPIHQERINQGEIIGWVLYRIHYTGADDEYNFVTVALFDDPAKLEHTFSVDMEKVHPEADLDELFEETMDSRQLVRQVLIRRVGAVYPEGGPGNFKYIQVNSMKVKPGHGGAYVNNEMNVWRPVHQALINADTRSGWSLWQSVYPFGESLPFDYVTVDYFADFSKLGAADVYGAFENAHAGKDIDMLMQETNESRSHVRAELWEVLDSVWKE